MIELGASGVNSQSGLAGKVIVVTGASTGIGAAAARLFAAEGAVVVLGARSADLLSTLADELAGEGAAVAWRTTDVGDAASIDALIATAIDTFGSLDGAFNNAGTTHYGDLAALSEDEFDRVMTVNVKGVWLAMRAQLRVMSAGGSIVNTASVAGYRGSTGIGAYPASKHAVIGLTKTMAREVGSRRIRVNAVAPGATETPIMDDWRRRDARAVEARMAAIPYGRANTAHEVAEAAAWLLSDRSRPITGVVLPIDGGSSV